MYVVQDKNSGEPLVVASHALGFAVSVFLSDIHSAVLRESMIGGSLS